MAHVSMKVLNEQLNIDQIIEDSRNEWGKRENSRRKFEGWLVRLIPFGLVIMAAVFYALSAPHTAGILMLITPQYGNIAPIGWELGIVIIAAVREQGWKNVLSAMLLWTLVLMSIVINVAGALISVIEQGSGAANITGDTVFQLIERYGTLPATYQVVLLIAVPVGAVIPLLAKGVGEILIKLAVGKIKLERESDEVRWARDRARVVYGSLFNAAIKAGAGTVTAGNWAKAITEQIFKEPVILQDAVSNQQQKPKNDAEMGFAAYALRQSQDRTGQALSSLNSENLSVSDSMNSDPKIGQSKIRLSKTEAVEWLQNRDDLMDKHPRDICKIYMLEVYGVESDSGYKTFERAKKDIQ